MLFRIPLASFEDLIDLRQLEGLFRSYTLLARIAGRHSPNFTDHCLMAYAMVMQMWKVSQSHLSQLFLLCISFIAFICLCVCVRAHTCACACVRVHATVRVILLLCLFNQLFCWVFGIFCLPFFIYCFYSSSRCHGRLTAIACYIYCFNFSLIDYIYLWPMLYTPYLTIRYYEGDLWLCGG